MRSRLPRPAAFALIAGLFTGSAAAAPPSDAPLPEAAFLNRITWGVNDASWREARQDGLERYLERQLHPGDDALPNAVAARIAQMRISREALPEMLFALEDRRKRIATLPDAEKEAEHKALQAELANLGREAASRSLLRDIYSKNQLREQMTWFWMNHFHVFAGKADLRALIGDFEDSAIRPHALGRFRDLLAATVFHPAMLRYLDNERNAAGHVNENYARELMELHTLGVDGGYAQQDVQELARILTGLGVARSAELPRAARKHDGDYVRRGLFEFQPARHDYGDKRLLGQTIRGAGLAEVQAAIDHLAADPATARHVSAKLARYFLGAEPSPALQTALAERYSSRDGDIAAVLGALFHSAEFRASLAHGYKDPVHYVVSAMRLLHEDTPITEAQPLLGALQRLGEAPYGWQSPEGYALDADSWSSPAQMGARFEVARMMAARNPRLFGDGGDQATPPHIAPALYREVIDASLGPATRQALARAASSHERLTFLLSSPEFMQR